jgi:hypothetical protein
MSIIYFLTHYFDRVLKITFIGQPCWNDIINDIAVYCDCHRRSIPITLLFLSDQLLFQQIYTIDDSHPMD